MFSGIFRNRILKSVFSFLLVLVLLFNFGVIPIIEANAIGEILLSGAISSVVGSLLTFSGIGFSSKENMVTGIEYAWDSFTASLKRDISDVLSSIGIDNGGVILGETKLPLSFELLTLATASLYKAFPPTMTNVPSGLVPSGGVKYVPYDYRTSPIPYFRSVPMAAWDIIAQYEYCIFEFGGLISSSRTDIDFYLFNNDPALIPLKRFSVGTLGVFSFPSEYFPIGGGSKVFLSGMQVSVDNGLLSKPVVCSIPPLSSDSRWASIISTNPSAKRYSFSSFSLPAVTSSDGVAHHVTALSPSDVLSPGIDYVPNDICVDGVITKAIDSVIAANPDKTGTDILVRPDVGELVGAVPQDVITDKALTDAIDKIIAGTGSGTITGDITLPTVGDLTIPEMIITVFPFSIPWDIARGLKVFKAEPVAPRFELPFVLEGVFDTKIVLDFSRFDYIIRFIRWGEITLFIVGLAIMTRKVIKW